MKKTDSTPLRDKVAYLGVFLALALICSYVESLIPFYFGIPGVKLGLTNIVVVLMLYCVGTKEAFELKSEHVRRQNENGSNGVKNEAVQALVALGYASSEALKA